METAFESADERANHLLPPSSPKPTARDFENARVRQVIAERQERAYLECLNWALGAFGPGWLPSHRHFLVSKDEEDRVRYTNERPQAAATVYTLKNDRGERRHFTIAGGRVVTHENYEDGFGAMLREPHPTRTIEVRGQMVHPHRYSLCWAPYELYTPKTAEQLVALRESRERKKADREDARWVEEKPLLAWAGLVLTFDEDAS